MMNSMKNILVYGGTGVQGEPLVSELLNEGLNVRVITRKPANVKQGESFYGDLGDISSLKEANRGIDGVMYILPLSNYDKMVEYTHNVVNAAKANNVQKIIMNTSVSGVDKKIGNYSLDLKVDAENVLRESGIDYLIFRPTIYIDNFIQPMHLENINERSIIGYATPSDFKVSWISLKDTSIYMIRGLLNHDLSNGTYNIGGKESLSGSEIAEIISEEMGKKINYTQVPNEQMKEMLNQFLGKPVGDRVMEFYDWAIKERGNLVYPISEVERILGHSPISINSWIKNQNWKRK